ncbi:DUF1772 domain-containing protein [Agrococcus sp. HG114]|uniref:anthrone oxygenase family protein n=1 Tax=Agrococcus sp. HG114 TaxID=2969757 RepID=UPI00215B62DC|nr:anthrone oxygenase family protein [Agrococcus sp. HG114]MCR8669967.1 DUF1772 domain-containing protein [Agrococcus sp. HG114]
MDSAGTVVLLIATVAAGVGAGVFLSFSNAVMPGLRRVDDRAFVAAFTAVDGAILNPLYLGGVFLGPLALAIAAALLHLGDAALAWILAAGALQLAVIAITGTVNVPRNDALRAAGDAARTDAAEARAAFDEARWSRWNHVRAVLSAATAACLAVALAS